MAPNPHRTLQFSGSTWLAGHAPGTLERATADEHRGYMASSLAQPERFLQLMMYDEHHHPVGFVEGSIRGDTSTEPKLRR